MPTRMTKLKIRTGATQRRQYTSNSISSTQIKTIRQVAPTPQTRTPTGIARLTTPRLQLPLHPVVDHRHTETTPRRAPECGLTLPTAPRPLPGSPDTRLSNTRSIIVAPRINTRDTLIRTSRITTRGLLGLPTMDRRMIMPTGHLMMHSLGVRRQETQMLMEAPGVTPPDRKRCHMLRRSLLARQAAAAGAVVPTGAKAAGVATTAGF